MPDALKKQSNAVLKTRTHCALRTSIQKPEAICAHPHAQTEAAVKAAERAIKISGLVDSSRRVGACRRTAM
jgi:hypothetical protein